MSSEALNVPEEHLREFIRLLHAGLRAGRYSREMRNALYLWIKEEEAYLKRMEADDD